MMAPPYALVTAQPFKLNGATPLTAPGIVGPFSVQQDPSGNDFSVVFQVVGTVTTLTVNLEISLDGGTTWSTFVATILTPAATVKVVTPVIAGALYRLNASALTGSQDFWVCTN